MFRNTVLRCVEFQRANIVNRISLSCIVILTFFLIFQSHQYLSKCFRTPHDGNWEVAAKIKTTDLDLCPIEPPNLLGPFTPDISEVSLDMIEKRFENVLQFGGYYKPKECRARYRVAIFVTCRGREVQLPILLKNLHPILMRQQLEYQIFVITQTHGFLFNKGALYNVGFIESTKRRKWDCIIFHDIDMIPMDDRNLYDCPRMNPRHMAVDMDKFNFT